MNSFKVIFKLLIFSLIVASCSTSHEAVTNNFIQKRKYRNGFYIRSKANYTKQLEINKKDFEKHENTGVIAENKKQLLNHNQNNYTQQLTASAHEDFQTRSATWSRTPNLKLKEINDTIIDYDKSPDTTENKIDTAKIENPHPLTVDNYTTTTAPKIEGFGIAGFSTCLVGLILVYIEPIALILAIISLVRFRRNPGKYKGKGFALGTIFMVLGLSVALLLLWILLLIIVF